MVRKAESRFGIVGTKSLSMNMIPLGSTTIETVRDQMAGGSANLAERFSSC